MGLTKVEKKFTKEETTKFLNDSDVQRQRAYQYNVALSSSVSMHTETECLRLSKC